MATNELSTTGRTKFKCSYVNAITNNVTTRNVQWREFYPVCGKLNLSCNPNAGAFLAAVTVCELHLWTWADQVSDAA